MFGYRDTWDTWTVTYWDFPSWENGGTINDCRANARTQVVKARTGNEAIRKAEKKVKGIFRLREAKKG